MVFWPGNEHFQSPVLIGIFLGASQVSAMPTLNTVHQTFFYNHIPSHQTLDYLSTLPGARGYIFQTQKPWAGELESLSSLRGADRIQVESDRFPDEDTLAAWKTLASRGVELVGLRAGTPVAEEIRQINDSQFSRLLLVLESFPTLEESKRLSEIQVPFSITFATNAFPKTENKEGLLKLPSTVPLLFVTDYWPWYVHMDLLNLLPQPRSIRVTRGFFPPQEALQYLRNIKNIQALGVETDFEPAPQEWQKFKDLPLTWTCQGNVPSEGAIKEFIAHRGSASRKLILNYEGALTQSELDRLAQLGIPVEWVHQGPQ